MTAKRIVAGVSFALGLSVAIHAQRDETAAMGTAEISGIVDTGSTSRGGVAGALVMVAGTDVGLIRVTTAGPDGRFVFHGLPAGHFLLGASLPPRLPALYGAAGANRPGQTIGLTAGQRLDGVRLSLTASAAIEGRVLDDAGEPLIGARVQVLPRRQIGDEIQLAGDAAPAITLTDDRGSYRISNLPPGDYLIAAQPRNPGFGSVRALTGDDVDGALAGRTLLADATPAPPGVGLTYAPVYYPDAAMPERATTVTLDEAADRSGLDLRSHLVRQSRIDGSVSPRPSALTPARNVTLTLRPRGSTATGAAINSFNAGVAPDGRFSLMNVPPGQYTLFVRTLPPPVPPGTFVTPVPLPMLWASRDLDVPSDIPAGLTLVLTPALSISGRVVIDGGAPLPRDLVARVGVRPTTSTNVGPQPEPVTIDGEGRFTIANLAPGRYRLFATVPASDASQIADWIPRSATWRGRDVLDVPLEVKPDSPVDDVVITLSADLQQVAGMVRDAAGRPVRDASVVVFPVDRGLWFPQSRRIAVRTSHADGEFVFGVATALPPGDYYVAAAPEALNPGTAFDPMLLGQLAASAKRIAVAPGANVTVELKLR